MRILLIHAEEFSYRTTQRAVKGIEEKPDIRHEGSFHNTLVAFITVEADDDESLIDEAINEIMDVAGRVKPRSIVIYPYAHLSSNLASPKKALELLDNLYRRLKEKTDLDVWRAPFGFYKSFSLKCYGHPLAELSKTIHRRIPLRVKHVSREYILLLPTGETVKPGSYNYSGMDEFRVFVENIVRGSRGGGFNQAGEYCRKFGIELNEEGYARLDDRGIHLVESVKTYIRRLVAKLDLNIKYFEIPILSSRYIELGEEATEVRTDNVRLYMRGDIRVPPELIPQPRNLANKVIGFFEYAVIHRFEKGEDLIPCMRHRLFTVPLLHMISGDLEQLMEKYFEIDDIIMNESIKYGQKYFIKTTLSGKVLDDMKAWINALSRKHGEPMLLEVLRNEWDKPFMNIGYYILDHSSRPVKIASTLLETRQDTYILHIAPIGSIERYLYMVFDSAAKLRKEGKTPYIPLWLSPIQVRLIPIKPEYLEYALKTAEKLSLHGVRVDIDDRWINLGKRIRDAGKEWIPYIIVIGEREVRSNTLNIRIRRTNDQMVMNIDEFLKYLESELEGYPRIKQLYPLRVSMRI